jgi:putative transposase
MSTKKHEVPEELLASLLADYKKPEDLIGENGLLMQLTNLLVEKALDAELAEHLGHGKNEPVANEAGNTRNGKSRKTLKGEFGELPIEVPRDRHGTFEPQLIPKHQDPLERLRRQDSLALSSRHDGAGSRGKNECLPPCMPVLNPWYLAQT